MSKGKEKGTRYETAVVRHLRDALGDPRPERMALAGRRDVGDVGHVFAHGREGVLECKCHERVTPALVGAWRDQTLAERGNAGADWAALVVSVHGRGVGRSEAHVTLRDLARVAEPLMVDDGWLGRADGAWVRMDLDDLIELMRGDAR